MHSHTKFPFGKPHEYQVPFPMLFDDTLTQLQKMNKIIWELWRLAQVTDGLEQDYQEFLKWLDSPFVKNYVNQKIEEMFQNGDFNEIIGTAVNHYVWINDFGAVGDGVTDDTQAIKDAIAHASTLGQYAMVTANPGNYLITDTIQIRNNFNFSQATFTYDGSGVAIRLGDRSASNIVTYRLEGILPKLFKKGRTVGWDGSSVGVECVNLNGSFISIPFVQDFETGVAIIGYDGGNAYNQYWLGALWENHGNLLLEPQLGNGYVNQNIFYGGRFQQTVSKGSFLEDPNAFQLKMAHMPGNVSSAPNNNTFISPCIEGVNISPYRVIIYGKYNTILNARYEAVTGNTPRIYWGKNARWNIIDGGYNLQNVEEVFDPNGSDGAGEIRDNLGIYAKAYDSTGLKLPTSTWTVSKTINNNSSHRVKYDSTTGYFYPRPGRYIVSARAQFASNGFLGVRQIRINHRGNIRAVDLQIGHDVYVTQCEAVATMKVDYGDYIAIELYQNSGAECSLVANGTGLMVDIEYLGQGG